MSEIKSARELALERVRDIKPDKAAVHRDTLRKVGQKIFAAFIKDNSFDISEKLRSFPQGDREQIVRSFLSVCVQNIVLPHSEEQVSHLRRLHEAITKIMGESDAIDSFFVQVENLFREYLQSRDQIEDIVLRQFSQEIKQKQKELSRQMGMPVNMDPRSFPEYTNRVSLMRSQHYQQSDQILSQIRNSLRGMLHLD